MPTSTGRRLAQALVAALAVLAVSGCATQVPGRAVAQPGVQPGAGLPDGLPSGSDRPAGKPKLVPPEVGQCVIGEKLNVVDCAQPHTVEVTKTGTLGADLPTSTPDAADVFLAALPDCRAEATKYLGNPDYDASTIAAWLLWPPAADWAAGERWYRCGVAQVDPAGKATERTGSLKNALTGDKFFAFQTCSSTKPSEKAISRVACTEPHLAEGLRSVTIGQPGDPMPNAELFNATAAPVCGEALANYLGATRTDVSASWRWPSQAEWQQGFTNITCFAQTETPVTKSLRNIGSAPLPS